MGISEKTLSRMRGLGIGLVFVTYISMCMTHFDLAYLTGVSLIGIDIALVTFGFGTVSQKIHSWFSSKVDFLIMVFGLSLFALILHQQSARGYIFKWSDVAIVAWYFTSYGHLWWYADR